jgi:hypothetical protein
MSLDLFSSNVDDAVNYAARVSAPELPSTFSDNFSDAWNRGFLTSQSVSGTNRKVEARSQLVDDAIAKTGDRTLASFISPTGDDSDFEGFNRRIAEHNAARPDDPVQPLSSEEIQARADRIGVQQLSDSRSLASRERTTGGTIGQFLGTAGAAVTDPVNMVAFPLAAPEALGILGTTLAWGAIGAGSQGVIEALNASSMERIQPGYRDSNEPLRNILEAGAGAAVIGGGLKGLSNLWTRAKTGSWPRTIRDAGNVVESEAQIASTNPLPGVGGEAAHRTALQKAIDDVANGRAVDVDNIVPPDQLAALDELAAPVLAAQDAASAARRAAQAASEDALASGKPQPDLPFVPTALEAQAELHQGTLTKGIQDIAATAGHEMPVEDAAKIATRIGQMNDPDKARAILDEVFLRPQTIVDTLPTVEKPASIRPEKINTDTATALRDEFAPAKVEEMRVDPDLPDTVSRDLDKLMLERPDLEVPTGVTVDAEGRTVPTTRKVESVVAEADARLAAAKEIEACVGPYPPEAAE